MSKTETKAQETTITINKENKNMKKEKKAPKTYTLKQILKTIVISLTLIAVGAFAGITIEKAIAGTINEQVKSQVQSFTQAVSK